MSGCLRPGVHLRIAGPRDKHPCCAVGSLWSDWRPLGVVQYSKVIFAIQIFAQYSCITVLYSRLVDNIAVRILQILLYYLYFRPWPFRPMYRIHLDFPGTPRAEST